MPNPTLADLRKLGIKIPAPDRPRAPFIVDEATRAVSFDVIVKTVSGMNARENPFVRAKRVKNERTKTREAMRGLSVPPLPVVVTMTRRSAGQLDSDAVPPALKSIRDEIAALYGVGDSPRDPIVWQTGQEKCRRGDHGVKVTIVASK